METSIVAHVATDGCFWAIHSLSVRSSYEVVQQLGVLKLEPPTAVAQLQYVTVYLPLGTTT